MTTTPATTATSSSSATHALYRFHDADGALLYVGITLNPGNRWRDHAHHKPWWHHVTTITVETHPDRATALDAERAAIEAEHPQHNIVHNRTTRSPRPPAAATAPARPDPIDMPDDCHDRCIPAGHPPAIYLPHRWLATGQAFYECTRGHRWTCWWPHTTTGDAPHLRGIALEVFTR